MCTYLCIFVCCFVYHFIFCMYVLCMFDLSTCKLQSCCACSLQVCSLCYVWALVCVVRGVQSRGISAVVWARYAFAGSGVPLCLEIGPGAGPHRNKIFSFSQISFLSELYTQESASDVESSKSGSDSGSSTGCVSGRGSSEQASGSSCPASPEPSDESDSSSSSKQSSSACDSDSGVETWIEHVQRYARLSTEAVSERKRINHKVGNHESPNAFTSAYVYR